jgi:2,3-diketo-5-methylthio-1-phosphopentane phosphatase
MTAAAENPAFPGGGAPLSVLVDFDGTISRHDVGDVLLSRHAPDQDEVARLDRRYDAGGVGSRELITWDMEVLPRDAGLLLREIETMDLDETFRGLVDYVRSIGGAVEVVSDGLGFHIEPMLARLGLDNLPVASNSSELGKGGAGVTFPYGHPRCRVCGTCKRERIRRHQEAGRAVVFVGDGTSDRYAAHHSDVTFAKAALASWCMDEGIEYVPWEHLADVTEWIRAAIASGRLPADASDLDVWERQHRATQSFICGPEVWGEGRTTPDR